jgi:hypothetical protein
METIKNVRERICGNCSAASFCKTQEQAGEKNINPLAIPEIEEMKHTVEKTGKGRLSISLDEKPKKISNPRTNWQRSATMPVFYKSKARAKNKLQKMSRKANR